MNKNNDNSTFDFDDQQFSEKFNKNIEKALGDTDTFSQNQEQMQKQVEELVQDIKLEEEVNKPEIATPSEKDLVTTNNGLNDTVATLEEPSNDLEDQEIEDKLMNINASLAKQIGDEIDSSSEQLKKKKKRKKILTGLGISFLSIILLGVFLVFTPPGNKLLVSMGVNASGMIWSSMTKPFDDNAKAASDVDVLDDDDIKSDAPDIDPATISWPTHPGEGRHEDGVYNILLLGEEAIGMGDGRGHTDVIVIATMNTNNKTVKLTSLMRDSYVQIPGYNDNKLNSAYAKGGLDLLYETIALNFDIKLDGCVKVNFKNFEKIIDRIGGIDVTLKKVEADYLNTTNYISNKKYRTVKEGLNHFNGNQALGYARIRHISTITGNNNDYGRTDRHRIILNAIFEKCKAKSKTDLAAMMVDFLPLITTDIDAECFKGLLNSFIDMGMSTGTIDQLRIPVNGAFKDNLKIRGMSVVVPDLPKNIEALHSFIFGDPVATTTPDAPKKSDDKSKSKK